MASQLEIAHVQDSSGSFSASFDFDDVNQYFAQLVVLSAGIDDQWPASFPGDIWSHSLYWLDISSSSDGDVTLFGISAEGHGHKRMSVNIPVGGDLKYALSTFSDKVAPITGYGVTGGLNTEKRWDGRLQDKCYEEIRQLTGDRGEYSVDLYGLDFAGSGKDLYENQWDAVYRSVKAQTWSKEESTQRLVVLVTDDIAHFSGQEKDVADNRNLSFEYVNSEGILGHIADPKLHYNRRSLDGTWDYYTEYYGRQMWDNNVLELEEPYEVLWKAEMWDFFHCCTARNSERRKCLAENKDDCDEDDNSCTGGRYRSRSDCKAFGGRYATAYNLKDDVPDSFFEGRVTKPDIKPYDYKQKEPITEAECSVMEYPNPQSKEFAAPFIENDVMLVVFIVVPDKMYDTTSGQPPIVRGPEDLWQYNHAALGRSALACPNMDHDPWLTVACGLFGKATADDNSEKCAELRAQLCPDEECERDWIANCLKQEYERQLKGLQKNGVRSALVLLREDFILQGMADNIKRIVRTSREGER